MGTYVSLCGWCEGTVTPEQVALMEGSLEASNMSEISVDAVGNLEYSGQCRYGFYDQASAAIDTMAGAANVRGMYDIHMVESPTEERIFFGDRYYTKMKTYDLLKERMDEATRMFQSHADAVDYSELAQWTLEKGTRL